MKSDGLRFIIYSISRWNSFIVLTTNYIISRATPLRGLPRAADALDTSSWRRVPFARSRWVVRLEIDAKAGVEARLWCRTTAGTPRALTQRQYCCVRAFTCWTHRHTLYRARLNGVGRQGSCIRGGVVCNASRSTDIHTCAPEVARIRTKGHMRKEDSCNPCGIRTFWKSLHALNTPKRATIGWL